VKAKEKKRAAAKAAKAAKGKGPDRSSAKRGKAPASGVGARGIGAMAAVAAAAARKKNDAVPPGGIGALAAAAAANKNKAAAGGTKDQPMKGGANPDSVLAAIRLQRSGSNRGISESESKAASKTPNARKTWDSERNNSNGEADATGAKSPFGVMASNYRQKKNPDAGKPEFGVVAARLKKSHSDTEEAVPSSAPAKKIGAKEVPSAAKKVAAKEAPPVGGRSSFLSSAAAYRRKKTQKNFDVEDFESDEEEHQSAKWMKPKEHYDGQDVRSKSVEAAPKPTKAVEPAAKNAPEHGDEIEPSAPTPLEEIKPASMSEEVKSNADTKDDDADNKSYAKMAADSTEINLKEDAEIEKNDNIASQECVESKADSAESKPADDADSKDNGAIPDEPTNIDVSADIEPKEDADAPTGNVAQKETDADSSSVVEPSLEESEQTNPVAEVAANSSSGLLPVSNNAPLEESEVMNSVAEGAASALPDSPKPSAKQPAEEANKTDTAAGTASAAPSSPSAPQISPPGSPILRRDVEKSTAQEEPKASSSAPDCRASPPPVELLVGFNTTPTDTGKKKKDTRLSDFFSRQNNERQVGSPPLGGRKSLAIVGDLFAKAARSFDKDCGLDDDEDNDSGDSSARDMRNEMLRNNFDDSSVAQMAGTLEQQPMSSRLSETWTKGDTIQNWSGWANQVITASDTDSVAGFEVSMDLRDEGDFDDESTIATFMDDNTIASAAPGYNPPYDDVAQTPGRVGQSISFEIPAVTPAKVAASILFADSPASSVGSTPQTGNVHKGRATAELDLDASLAFPADVGLDAGLSFGCDHLDLDDGLGFGGAGGLSGFGGPPIQDDKSPDKKKWFAWGGNH
jgi:hypothetical protein